MKETKNMSSRELFRLAEEYDSVYMSEVRSFHIQMTMLDNIAGTQSQRVLKVDS